MHVPLSSTYMSLFLSVHQGTPCSKYLKLILPPALTVFQINLQNLLFLILFFFDYKDNVCKSRRFRKYRNIGWAQVK
jgi:hypothetical protein